MAGPEVRLLMLLLLLLTRHILSQETTSQHPTTTTAWMETTTAPPQTTTDPPTTSSGQQWTQLEDDRIELDGFTGSTIPAPELQEARHLRIVNSDIQTIAEGIFPVDPNVTNATLEIINTTIHQWNNNNMDSFANVTITDSRIKQLNGGGIRFTLRSNNLSDMRQRYGIVVLFHGTTIDELHADGLDLGPGPALLQLTGCNVSGLHGQALRLGLGVTLRVEDTVIGELKPTSLSEVCSLEVHFEGNRLLHVPPHALHFGSPRCGPQPRDIQCRTEDVLRRVTISDTSLPCKPLGWLRDALHSDGSLTDNTHHDYVSFGFGNTSHCSDRLESVQSFLLRKPEPEPEPAASWWHSEVAAAGIAVALAIGFLLVGLLAGCALGGARGTAARHSFQRAVSRRVHDHISDGDAGITLPLERMRGRSKTDGTDADPRRRVTDGRYGPGPVRPGSPTRPRARTPETEPAPLQHGRLPAPLPQKTTQRSPRPPQPGHKRPKRGKRQPAADPQSQNQWPQQAGAAAADHQIYQNQQEQHGGDGTEHDSLYQNQWPQQAGAAAADHQIYQNQQEQPGGDGTEHDSLYQNQWPQQAGAAAADQQIYQNQQEQPSGHDAEHDSLYQNQPSNPQYPEGQVYVNQQWPEAPANQSAVIYENLHGS